MHPVELEKLRLIANVGHTLVWSELFWTTEFDRVFPNRRIATARALLSLHQQVILVAQGADHIELEPDHQRELAAFSDWLKHEAERQSSEYFAELAALLESVT